MDRVARFPPGLLQPFPQDQREANNTAKSILLCNPVLGFATARLCPPLTRAS